MVAVYRAAASHPAATPQSEPIEGETQVRNAAGGYVYPVDDWTRLERFLILGSESGTYYASPQKLTAENAKVVMRCLAEDGGRTLATILDVSETARAPKNSPSLFALALVLTHGDLRTRSAAADYLPRIARTASHLFELLSYCDSGSAQTTKLRGWGSVLRRGVRNWYTREPAALAYQMVKYRERSGYSHRDAMHLAHVAGPKTADGSQSVTSILRDYAHKGWPSVGVDPHPEPALRLVWAFERAKGLDVKKAGQKSTLLTLIGDYGLTHEMLPTSALGDADIWRALLMAMPLGALVRNLGRMSALDVFESMPLNREGLAMMRVSAQLRDPIAIRRSRLHPIWLLYASKSYAMGRGLKGSLTWYPHPRILDALTDAFHLAFANVPPTGKRRCIALDFSGSMEQSVLGLPNLSAREAEVALALHALSSGDDVEIVAFSCAGSRFAGGGSGSRGPQPAVDGEWRPSGFPAHPDPVLGRDLGIAPVPFSSRQRLDDALRLAATVPAGGTDCALPMLWAREKGRAFDSFEIYTDNETWAGWIHPSEALREYRRTTGIPAKLTVCAMTSTGYSIADPEDAGMLDVVGLDAAAPAIIADFVRGGVAGAAGDAEEDEQ